MAYFIAYGFINAIRTLPHMLAYIPYMDPMGNKQLLWCERQGYKVLNGFDASPMLNVNELIGKEWPRRGWKAWPWTMLLHRSHWQIHQTLSGPSDAANLANVERLAIRATEALVMLSA